MKFLCDVHISIKFTKYLNSKGFKCVHVNDILEGSRTKDRDICQYADQYGYTVITKDKDFRDTYLVKRSPIKLIKVNLGNISNKFLIALFDEHLKDIEKMNQKNSFLIELDLNEIYFIEI